MESCFGNCDAFSDKTLQLLVLYNGGIFMSEVNLALLTQKEIDTLVKFLKETSDSVDSEVLSQDSIDKLIHMMRTYSKKTIGNHKELGKVKAMSSVLDASCTWSISYEENQDDGYIKLYATDGKDKEYITPRGYSCACFVEDDSEWGYAISPVHFVDVAKTFQLKFSKDTYEEICKRFADKNYGDASYDVDDFFLATGKDLMGCLL